MLSSSWCPETTEFASATLNQLSSATCVVNNDGPTGSGLSVSTTAGNQHERVRDAGFDLLLRPGVELCQRAVQLCSGRLSA
jgi:hypothetical protein